MKTTRIILSSLILRNRATVGAGLVSDQARFFRCFPAIALLLGALFLFAAPPASAEAPAAPTGLTVTAGDAELLLAWTPPVDDIAGYEVDYTSAPKTGSGAVADTAAASGSDPSVAWVAAYILSSSTTSWTISGLTNNTIYRVRIRAIGKNLLKSPWAVATVTPPAAPTGLTVTADNAELLLEWTAPADAIAGYEVDYTSAPKTGSGAVADTAEMSGSDPSVAWVAAYILSSSTTSWTISGLTNNTIYRVRIRAIGKNLLKSPWAVATGTPEGSPDSEQSTIVDDGDITAPAKTSPTVQLSASPNPVDEGSSVTLTLTLSEAAASQVVIPVTLTNVWAESGDYGTLSSITIPAGGTIGTGTITTAQDTDSEHETFRVTLGTPPSGYVAILSSVQIMIRDDEAAQNGAGAAPIARAIHDNQTPGLSIFGSIVDEGTGVAKEGFRVKVKNLTTKASASEITSIETADGYSVTLLDLANARATRVGDVLEISAESPNPRIGVEPVRHIVTVDDVKRGTIQLEALIAYEIPAGTELLRNYPNPFNPETWIPYRLSEDADVSLTIYDANGALVRTIDVGHQSAAVYESRAKAIYWDGRNHFGEQVASGVYFYSLSAGDFSATRRMVILK